MDFINFQKNYHELLDYLEEERYSTGYIRCVRENILWILKNESTKTWQTYVDIYNDRACNSNSDNYKKRLRVAFGTIQQFDLYGEYPNRKSRDRLIKRSAYHQLTLEFKKLVDYYTESESVSDIKTTTINGNAGHAAVFLYEMQKRGIDRLDLIGEEDVLSFFVNNDGTLLRGSSYKKSIASVFRIVSEWKENECGHILAFLPKIRPRRKNIQYLRPQEIALIRSVLDDENSGLSLRNRAIGELLFFTGLRACDIAKMKINNIKWEADEIHLAQQKTNQPLVLPLTAAIGNSIYDYLANERPASSCTHLFLSSVYPYYPLGAGALWALTAKIYKASGIRQNKGERRGTHLFRHNIATSFLGSGIARPVISKTLGHTNPLSLEPYLHADMANLKKCALSIEGLPVREEVFNR